MPSQSPLSFFFKAVISLKLLLSDLQCPLYSTCFPFFSVFGTMGTVMGASAKDAIMATHLDSFWALCNILYMP